MSRWFRFYDCVLDDPKVQRLPGDLFKAWVNMLCIASRNKGVLPGMADLAFMLRMDETSVADKLHSLCEAGLIETGESGLSPHNWNERQFKSDGSTERVKRFRERSMKRPDDVSETSDATGPETDTDTETDTQQSARDDSVSDFRKAISDCFLRVGQQRPDTSRAEVWLARGWNPQICLAVIGEVLARKKVTALSYFEQPIADAHQKPEARGPAPAAYKAPVVDRTAGKVWVNEDSPEGKAWKTQKPAYWKNFREERGGVAGAFVPILRPPPPVNAQEGAAA